MTDNLEELITPLRIQIGDTGSSTYTDDWLHEVLRYSVNSLMPRWNNRYYVDNDNVVQRNDTYAFEFSSPPVIQRSDHRAIILQASIMIKGGYVYTNAGSAVSWRDDEISCDARQASALWSSSLKQDTDELNMLLPKRLAAARYGRLYGYTEQ